ncbi:MAG: DUF1932 domain-containing protein [Hyphomonas sp.]
MMDTIGIIGFGEAAQTFTGDPRWSAKTVAYDIKFSQTDLRPALKQRCANLDVEPCFSNRDATTGAHLLLSLVTADQAFAAATETAKSLTANTLYLDMNSVAPDKKRDSAAAISKAGGRYVDVAIMAPVQPACLAVPLLISGEHAADAAEYLSLAGFTNIRMVGSQIGDASAIKMIRSVMIKGIEALTAECLLAADAAGVIDDVLASLGGDWPERANYNLERMLVHGQRRAAEMEEVCATLESLGVEPALSRGTAARQSALGQIGCGTAPDTLTAKLALIKANNKVDAV